MTDTDLIEKMAEAMARPELIICRPGDCEDCDSWRDLAKAATGVMLEEMRKAVPTHPPLSGPITAFLDAFAKEHQID